MFHRPRCWWIVAVSITCIVLTPPLAAATDHRGQADLFAPRPLEAYDLPNATVTWTSSSGAGDPTVGSQVYLSFSSTYVPGYYGSSFGGFGLSVYYNSPGEPLGSEPACGSAWVTSCPGPSQIPGSSSGPDVWSGQYSLTVSPPAGTDGIGVVLVGCTNEAQCGDASQNLISIAPSTPPSNQSGHTGNSSSGSSGSGGDPWASLPGYLPVVALLIVLTAVIVAVVLYARPRRGSSSVPPAPSSTRAQATPPPPPSTPPTTQQPAAPVSAAQVVTPPASGALPKSQVHSSRGSAFCPYCGTASRSGQRFCRSCGKLLD
jgi:hypothetical protein